MLWQPSLPESYTKATPDELAQRITERRRELGGSLVILGHHYQQDAVIDFADFTGFADLAAGFPVCDLPFVFATAAPYQ